MQTNRDKEIANLKIKIDKYNKTAENITGKYKQNINRNERLAKKAQEQINKDRLKNKQQNILSQVEQNTDETEEENTKTPFGKNKLKDPKNESFDNYINGHNEQKESNDNVFSRAEERQKKLNEEKQQNKSRNRFKGHGR